MVENELGLKLVQLREKRRQTQEEVAAQLNTVQTVISRHERTGKVGRTWLERYAAYYKVTLDYLYGKDDKMEQPLPEGAHEPGPLVGIPIYGTIRAGVPMFAQEDIIGWEPTPADDIKGGTYFYLRVTGDSMKNANIPDGALVLVRKQDQADSGNIAVIIVDGMDATVKIVKYEEDGRRILLIPANPDYLPESHDSNTVRILGKVVKATVSFE